MLQYLNTTERDAVLARKGKQFIRKQFLAPGVNYVWAVDQHDKMKRFGLRLHICVEPFTGKIIWLVVYWTNSNPRYITRQYLQAVKQYGMQYPDSMPMADFSF